MRKAILAMLTAIAFAALRVAPAAAVGTRYPFWIPGDEYPGLSNCTFTSYEQCQATASGRYLSCTANPYYVERKLTAAAPSPLPAVCSRRPPPAAVLSPDRSVDSRLLQHRGRIQRANVI